MPPELLLFGSKNLMCPYFSELPPVKNFGNILKNNLWQSSVSNVIDKQPAILIQKASKGDSKNGYSVKYQKYQNVPKIYDGVFCGNIFIINIWHGPNVF